ncbi:MAG: DUF222 domain-containing protein, partial [Mycobacterium sp.]
MSSSAAMVVREQLVAARGAYRAAMTEAAAVLAPAELLEVLGEQETFVRSLPALEHPMMLRLQKEISPVELGGTNLADVVSRRLRTNLGVARQRIEDAAMLGPRTSLTGQPLPPLWPGTAAAQADGLIGAEHLAIIRKFFKHLPEAVGYEERELAEQALALAAGIRGPKSLQECADTLAGYLNPDGEFSDADRARKRGLS